MTTHVMDPAIRSDVDPPRPAPALAVVLDHAHARFFLVDAARVTELPCLVSPRMRGGRFHSDREDSPGWGEAAFHGRRREEERRHCAAIARRLGALVRAHQAQELVLGGSDPVVAAFKRVLPARLFRLVVGTARLNPTELTNTQVLTCVLEVRRAGGLLAQEPLVNAVVEGFGSGMAVDGLRPVLAALGHDQVRTLMVVKQRARPGYRCAASGRLVLTKPEAGGEAVVRVSDLIVAAEAEAQRLGGTVVEIGDPRQASRIDGVAALLRYP